MRKFLSGSSEKITTGLGALGFAFGPGTIAMWADPGSGASACLLGCGSVSSARYSLTLSAGKPALKLNTSTLAVALTAISGLCLIVVTKATGTAAPRFHVWSASSGTWNHENSATSVANSTAPDTRCILGADFDSSNFYSQDLGTSAVWNVVLTDSQCESLLGPIIHWFAPATPKAMWMLDQDNVADLVSDITGQGADQSAITGTAVATVSGVWTPNAGAVILAKSQAVVTKNIAGTVAAATAVAQPGTPSIKVDGSQATAVGAGIPGTPSIKVDGAQASASAVAQVGTPRISVTGAQASATGVAQAGSVFKGKLIVGVTAQATAAAQAGFPSFRIDGAQATATAVGQPGVVTGTGGGPPADYTLQPSWGAFRHGMTQRQLVSRS